MNQVKVKTFWEFANERHNIYLLIIKGAPWPWTDDPILREFYFCNIFRELDKTTAWFRDNIRGELENSFKVIMATVIFRWFNNIPAGKIIWNYNLYTDWYSPTAKLYLSELHPIVTGAYIIKTPDGMDKLTGVCWCIDQMWEKREEIKDYFTTCDYLEQGWDYLKQFPYMGPFMAYEVITDLRHTCVLRKAHDICGWANIGPGAKRGLEYLEMDITQESLLKLLGQSTRAFPHQQMEMRDIEHTLCEYAKYRNALAGKRLKRRYHHGT
jgi:hypothetical protein